MRTSAVAMILILTSLVASARDPQTRNKKVVCADPKTVIEGLTADSDEQPFWTGVADSTKFILFVNTRTGTWSLVQYDNKTACVLGVGEKALKYF
jgi:hypothetical protein